MTDTDPTIEVTEGGSALPVVDVLTGRGAIFGKSGSGKSNTVGVIAEELLEQNFPLLIIDTDGEHYGLKEEYQLLHVGATADECDAAVGPEHADELAHLALDEGVPVILDTSEYIDSDEVDELVRKLVLALFRLEKSRKVPFPIFLEEAHEFIEQTNHPDEVGEALIKVAKRGRKRGLGLTVMSQRPANVNKDVVTQSDWSIWHKLTWPQDTSVVKDVVGPEYATAVQDLDTGEAILSADDWLDGVRTVTFKRKRTFDAGETPGLDEFTRPELQPVDADVLDTLTEVTQEEAEEEDRVAALEAERDRLEAKVTELENDVERLESDTDGSPSEEVQTLREKKQALEERVESLQTDLSRAQSELDQQASELDELHGELDELRSVRDDLDTVTDHLRSALAEAGEDPQPVESADEEMRDRVESLESKIDTLEAENERLRESDEAVTISNEYEEFYEHSTVEDAIEGAISEGKGSEKAVWATILTIAEIAGPATYEEIQERGGYSNHSAVSQAVTALESRGVLDVVSEKPKEVDFNFAEMAEIERKNKIREEMEERIEQKVS